MELEQLFDELSETLQEIVIESEVKKEDMEAFLTTVIHENLGQTFVHIAAEFLPKKKDM